MGIAGIGTTPLLSVGADAQTGANSAPSRTSPDKAGSAAQNATSKLRSHAGREAKQNFRVKTTQGANRKPKSNGQPPLALLAGAAPPRPQPAKPPVALPAPSVLPVITYFDQDAQKWLRASETVYVTMQGTPGAQATFHIGTLTGNIVMRESSPGQYLGSWTVPADKTFPTTPFKVMGELRANGKAADPMPASRLLQIDMLAPTVANTSPLETASATPPISADLRDEGSGIDIASLHLRVNGRDVTGSAQVTADHIAYTPMMALPTGDQTVELQVSDRAGNRTMHTWHFTVK